MQDTQDILQFIKDNTNCQFDVNVRTDCSPLKTTIDFTAKNVKYYYMLRVPKWVAKFLPVSVKFEDCNMANISTQK